MDNENNINENELIDSGTATETESENDSRDIFDIIAEETGADEQQEAAPEKPVKKKKKGRTVLITVLVLVLLLISASVFSNLVFNRVKGVFKFTVGSGDKTETFTLGPKDEEDRGEDKTDSFFSWILPGDDEDGDSNGEESGSDEEMPGSFEDYLDSYYTSDETSAANVKVERAKLPIDFEMKLEEPGENDLTLQELYADCAQSVVAIMGYVDKHTEYSWGTGIILSEDGLIVTNTHVIDDCDRATVTLSNDEVYEAQLVGADSTSDIAVLKIDAKKLPAAHFSRSDALVVGDSVAAIGNPLGESFKFTLTNGIISGIDRGVSYNGRTMTVLQTNTALNSGNSGGPLFNMHGQVIGVTNMKMMSSYSSIEGIGFAIPTTTVRQIVNGLVKDGEFRGRPSIGMTVGAVPENAKDYYTLPGGLYVSLVTEGSGADKAGLKKGDIVTKVNGIEVSVSNDVLDILSDFAVGDMLPMTIWRNGKIIEIEVELMDMNDLYG